MRIAGYESGLYYNCKLCEQAINKRGHGVTAELVKMRLCPKCYDKKLRELIRIYRPHERQRELMED